MIICPKCSKELSDGTKFCDGCGAKLPETVECNECEKEASAEVTTCQECETSTVEASAVEAPAEVEAETQSETQPEAQPKAQPKAIPEVIKKLPPNLIKFGVIGVAIIAILIFIISAISGGSGKSKNNYALYIKDSEIYYNNLKKNKDPLQLTTRLVDNDNAVGNSYLARSASSLGIQICMSQDGKYIFFPDKVDGSDINLYYRKVDKPKEEAVKIDSGITSYTVNTSATLVTYRKDGNLYQYNIKKDSKDKIASDVGDYRISENGKKIIYINSEDNLYLKNGSKEKEKIASEVSDLKYVSEDFNTIYYTKDDSLYKRVKSNEPVKIASDIYSVINIYDSGEIYYLTNKDEKISLINYVTDDMKEQDASIIKPEYPEYNSPEYPEYPDAPEYPSWNDYETDEEYYAASDAYYEAYEEWEEECDRIREDYNDACEKYDEDYELLVDEYNVAYDKYREKASRDDLREDLEERTLSRSGYSLCYYNGKEEVVITDAFDGYSYDYTYAYDVPVISYEAYSQSNLKKVKLSEVDSVYDIEDMVEDALYSSTERYIAIKNNATVLEQEKDITNLRINSKGTVAYYIDDVPNDKSHGTLYRIKISKNKIGKAEVYDNDVYSGYSYFVDEDEFMYFKDVKSGKGELYIDKDKVDYDVELYSTIEYDSDLNRLLYYTDWNDEKDLGTLKAYNGKKSVKISDDVHDFTVTPDGRVLYLYDYSVKNYRGELFEWSKNKAKKLDEDVVAILDIIY